MKLTCLIILLASAGQAAESAVWKGGEGNWREAAKWSGPAIDPTRTVAINERSRVTIDEGEFCMSRLDLGERKGSDATLIMNGGMLGAVEFIRLGELPGTRAQFVLNGGLVCTTELSIGGMNTREESSPPCIAGLEIRGGCFVTKYLTLGWQPGSKANFRIVGTKPERIAVLNSMNCALTDARAGSTGEVAFELDAHGVTPIEHLNRHESIRLSRKDGAGKCLLQIVLLNEPPVGEITLIRSAKPTLGTFHELGEGSIVRVGHGGRTFEWRLTYRGGESKCDIVLTDPHIVRGGERTSWTGGGVARAPRTNAVAVNTAWKNLYRHIDAITPPLASGPLAFPGAEGFGAHARGGRGGRALFVTNLNDSGPGSLREALGARGPRTVIFRVGGVIELQSPLQIREPFVTIAGQTAPGDGICLKGAQDTLTLNGTHDVIVRFLRVRTGHTGDSASNEGDCIACYNSSDFIIDHCSMSWGTDETLSCTGNCDRFTVQWCVMAEGLDYHGHSMGSILGGDRSTWHHNLWAHCRTRNPRFAGLCRCDFRNNVVYNWGDVAGYGDFRELNYVNNFLKPGPSMKQGAPSFITGASFVLQDSLFAGGNAMDGVPALTADNRAGIGFDAETFASKAHGFPPVRTQGAQAAAELVFAAAGAVVPRRDAVDARIIREAREGTGRILRTESEVGGCPGYAGGVASVDTDNDGIPDTWEKTHGLDPNDSADAELAGADGITPLERYLNSLVPDDPALPNP